MIIEPVSLILGIIGIITGYYFYRKSSESDEALMSALNDLWEATPGSQMSDQLLNNWIDVNLKLQEDEYRAGHRRGKIRKNQDGTFSIDWIVEVTDGIHLSDQVNVEVTTQDDQEHVIKDPYIIPVMPHAIMCPHCENVQPPTSSTCSACGKKFDWEEAYHRARTGLPRG